MGVRLEWRYGWQNSVSNGRDQNETCFQPSFAVFRSTSFAASARRQHAVSEMVSLYFFQVKRVNVDAALQHCGSLSATLRLLFACSDPLASRPNSSGVHSTALPLPMTSVFVTVAGVVPKPGPQFSQKCSEAAVASQVKVL